MEDFISEFLAALRADGFTPKDGKIHADDKWNEAYYGNEKGNKCSGSYTLKIIDDGFAIGCYKTFKGDIKFNWHSNAKSDLTAEQRKENKLKIEEYKKTKQIKQDRDHAKISSLLTKAYKNLPKATNHQYCNNKGISLHGLRLRPKSGELIMPAFQPDGKIWTIQRITNQGKKFLFKGGKKKGSYFPFVKKGDDMGTILVCEGFSTGATIREATGYPVASAIDSGNLKPVLANLKNKFPNSRFIICADNDAFTKNAKGEDWNVGIEKAKEAAVSIGGAHVIYPDFEGLDQTKKPSDYNDLADIESKSVVKAQIMEAINAIPAEQDEVTGGLDTRYPDQHPSSDGYYPPDHHDDGAGFEEIPIIKRGDFDLNFRCLGYNDGMNYYFSFAQRRIVSLSPSQHTIQNLLQLDNYDNWYNSQFAAGAEKMSEKKLSLYAQNAMNQSCVKRGIFKEEDNVRGSGAWVDSDRIIVHCGDRLFTGGNQISFDEIESDFTYVAAPRFMRPDFSPLSNSEAYKLREICEGVTWENSLSGSLLAGWLVIAPVCGALDYRPHIWITGEAESGKSTVINKIVRGVLGRMSINVEGGTTEASLREAAGHDARPLVYDEAESSQTMVNVVELARKATSGGIVRKYGQGQMRIRFAACFSSINPPVDKTADESRISFLVIKKNRNRSAIKDYEKLLDLIEKNITPEFSDRLIARTVKNMGTLFKNIKIFQKAARRVINGARASEQIGTMLAGLYLLHSTKEITEELAQEWVKKYDWKDHTTVEDDTDPMRMIQHLSGAIIRYSASGTIKENTIGNLILEATTKDSSENKALRMYGISRIGNNVFIANRSQHLGKIFKGTDWAVRWSVPLLNIEGSEKISVHYFTAGMKTSAVSLPISIFTDDTGRSYELNFPEPDRDVEEIPF